MLLFLRIALFLVTAGSVAGGFVYLDKAPLTSGAVNPETDAQFADIDKTGFDWAQQQTQHNLDYMAALQAYHGDTNSIAQQAREFRNKRDEFFDTGALSGLLFLIAMLPWVRWDEQARRSSRALADKAGKLAVKGAGALSALREVSPIVGRSGLQTYSIADELSKWSKLHDDGVVSDSEFDQARARLLSRDKA